MLNKLQRFRFGRHSGWYLIHRVQATPRLELQERVSLPELTRAGYYHRDPHLDNLLVDDQKRLVWIDTHVKALPNSAKKRGALLDNMLTNSRIDDAAYRTQLRARLAPYF
ncbi:hypothetical protein HW452_08395 [Halomonas aquamarina]|uniref:Uncharacterized protein n=1 Tax=Vreelandella aquamarina TaxID=77097 RepID=A0ACC5VUI9_9GAMM|nr:hypothetical protein [Halomonas aquamarina]MBZ5487543.1 hypothetical protein [Halomonas aquamarina]